MTRGVVRETPDAGAFTVTLLALGIEAKVEVRGSLALLVPTRGVLPTLDIRRRVEELARESGFSHVALELLDHS